jgi:hypothetical protein
MTDTARAPGIDLFQAANRRLEVLGIRTPRINLADRSRSHHPADIAVVEDVPGENWKHCFATTRAAWRRP